MQDGLQESRDHFRNKMSSRTGSNSPTPGGDPRAIARSRQHARRSVIFTPALQVHRYPPAVWGEEEEVDDDDEWDVGGYEDEDLSLAEEAALAEQERRGGGGGGGGGDSDDGMSWEEALPDRSQLPGTADEQRRQQELHAQQLQQQKLQELQQQQQQQEAEQQASQQQRQQIEEQRRQQQLIAQVMAQQAVATPSTQGTTGPSILTPDSREQLAPPRDSSASTSPSSSNSHRSIDPAEALETKKISITPLVLQDNDQSSRQAQPRSGGPMLPSEVMQRQEDERKRTREEIGALEDARKKAKSPSNGRANGGPTKLRK